MINDLTNSEVEKIVDLTYLIIKVIIVDNEVAAHLSDMIVTLMMTITMIVQRLLRS